MAQTAPARPSATDDPAAERKPFAVPTLEVFTDMKEFLLVDPIHEVDERGLPQRDTENTVS